MNYDYSGFERANRKLKIAKMNVIGVNMIFSNSLIEKRLPIVLAIKSKNISHKLILMNRGFNFTFTNPAFMPTTIIIKKLIVIEKVSKTTNSEESLIRPPHTIAKGIIPASTKK
jgi:23S rRNA A1618 N6-methylase RlmF